MRAAVAAEMPKLGREASGALCLPGIPGLTLRVAHRGGDRREEEEEEEEDGEAADAERRRPGCLGGRLCVVTLCATC